MIRITTSVGFASVTATTDAPWSPDVWSQMLTTSIASAISGNTHAQAAATVWADDGEGGDLTGLLLGDDEDDE